MPRIIDDPLTHFRALVPPDDGVPLELAEEARRRGIPIIGPVMGRLLAMLCRISGARRVLELGSAVGYSTLFLARAMREGRGFVLGVEMHEAHCRAANEALRRAGLDCSGTVVCADARALPAPTEGFDLVFLDVDQRYYTVLEPVCHAALRPGGLLVADNTSFADAAAFNGLVADQARWDAVNILAFLPQHAPEQDGFCLARKIPEEN